MAVGQLAFMLKGDRYREQAHSYKDLCSAGQDGHPHRPRFWGMTPFPRGQKTSASHLQTPLIRTSPTHPPHLGMEGVQALCN
jgi:hypothetical protein